MSAIVFGAGVLWGTPATTAGVQNGTPIEFGILQDIQLDVDAAVKELYGQFQLPVAIGRGKAKLQCKAKFAQIQGSAYSTLFFGGAYTPVAPTLVSYHEGPTAIPTTPFQITVTHSATFVEDLGVKNATTGTLMQMVTGTPTAGQYKVASGVYTFSSADQVSGISVIISYSYTSATANSGIIASAGNPLMGVAPVFRADFHGTYNGIDTNWTLFQCVATKLTLPTKLDDFTVSEFDFSAFADSSGRTLQISIADLG